MILPAPHVSLAIAVEEMSGVGEARRSAIRLAEALAFNEADVGRVAIIVTEAASNLVQHAKRGEILLRPFARTAPASLEILAFDKGPGLANVTEALRDGFSTGGSSGLGLGAIARLSTQFEIFSSPGLGTAILSRVGRLEPRTARRGLQWGAVCVPKRGEDVCGDAWAVRETAERTALLVVDGLGHGIYAFDAASEALRSFEVHASESPVSLLRRLDESLRTTRGAVAAACDISWNIRQLRYAGAGNIAAVVVPATGKSSSLVSHNGTLGAHVEHFQEFDRPFPADGLLILHSDGLSSRWTLDPYPGLAQKDPSLIAAVLYRDFANRRDDVVIVVGRDRAPEREPKDAR